MKKLLFIVVVLVVVFFLLVALPVFAAAAEEGAPLDNFQKILAYYGSFLAALSVGMTWLLKQIKKLNESPRFSINIGLFTTITAIVLSLGFSAYATLVIQWDWILFGVGAIVLYFGQAGIALGGFKPFMRLVSKDKNISK